MRVRPVYFFLSQELKINTSASVRFYRLCCSTANQNKNSFFKGCFCLCLFLCLRTNNTNRLVHQRKRHGFVLHLEIKRLFAYTCMTSKFSFMAASRSTLRLTSLKIAYHIFGSLHDATCVVRWLSALTDHCRMEIHYFHLSALRHNSTYK